MEEQTSTTADLGGDQHPAGTADGAAPDESGEGTGSYDYEGAAREKGWRPKEEYEGDAEGWVGAEEFVKRQPLFDKIKVQSKRLKELEKTVEAMAKHYQTSMKQAKEKAIADLKTERREAIDQSDHALVEDIDARIEQVNRMADVPVPQNVIAPEIEDFIEQQKDWFNKDDEMTAFAVSYNETYLKRHPDALGESLKETLKAVRKAFPEKFANQKRTAPPTVEGGGQPTGGNSKYSISKLTKEQKLVYDQLVKTHKQMSHDEYFKQLDQAGYLEG